MEIKEAIEVLKHYNVWRKGDDENAIMTNPKRLGVAIDTVVSEFENLFISGVSNSLINELKRRQTFIQTEPNGQVRETMIDKQKIIEILNDESVSESSSNNNRIIIEQDFDIIADEIVKKIVCSATQCMSCEVEIKKGDGLLFCGDCGL